MKAINRLLSIVFFGLSLSSWPSLSNAATFKGAWFEVWVPPNFTALPSTNAQSPEVGVDSAFFRSPDKQVEFYVFSPQWNGEPREIALNPATETLGAKETKSAGNQAITYYTIQAKNNAYTRAYQDTSSPATNTRLVFGIKYANQAAYDRYRDTYIKFKKSLRQFAD
ncbi:hypothetical protein [uncultured Thiodictyon sp.]|uniref:hypothetical protein n=1 Tax=uncultured Thiodictyon sp. TaxID=1846217 RepID=UPI0025D097D5|nr:hypothetical protein [uncultured Thiodictyon sp.]